MATPKKPQDRKPKAAKAVKANVDDQITQMEEMVDAVREEMKKAPTITVEYADRVFEITSEQYDDILFQEELELGNYREAVKILLSDEQWEEVKDAAREKWGRLSNIELDKFWIPFGEAMQDSGKS